MKLFTPARLLITTIAAIVFLYTCKKDKNIDTSLVGTWIYTRTYEKAVLFNQTYLFGADSSVQVTRTLTDSASGSLLGYQYLSKGKFRLNGSQLKLYGLSTVNYTGGTPYYTTIDKLIPFPADTLETYNISINADDKSFYFVYPPCGPAENCIGTLVYKKQ